MKSFAVIFLIACSVFAGSTLSASAQGGTWADRGYVNLGAGVQSGSATMADSRTSSIYAETATITTSTTFKSGAIGPDVAFGLRVWRNMTVGVGFGQQKRTADGTISGSVPSPIFFNRPRTLSGSVTGLERTEQGTHINLGWVLPFSNKLDVMVYGGPSFFRVSQDMISDVTLGEQGGAFTSVVAQSTVTQRKKSVTGYNVGADATYILWSNDNIRVGAGGFVRFAKGSAKLLMLASEQSTDIGGVQYGFGARVRF